MRSIRTCEPVSRRLAKETFSEFAFLCRPSQHFCPEASEFRDILGAVNGSTQRCGSFLSF